MNDRPSPEETIIELRARMRGAMDGLELAVRHQTMPRGELRPHEIEEARRAVVRILNEALALWLAAIDDEGAP